MGAVKKFFCELGFDFDKSLSKPTSNFFIDNHILNETLKNKVFYFKSPNQTNTSFYLVTVPLQSNEFNVLRKYIWNENKADLLFYNSNSEEDFSLDLFYSKASPIISIEDCKLDTFTKNEKDIEKIKRINHWQFESGAFWLNYHTFLKKATQKGIDKELIGVLTVLKLKLLNEILKIDKNKAEEVVQALIDRTLYIKYLEDNHIINSYFYTHYFKSAQIDYKRLLENNKTKELNKLFKVIHSTFNNSLFDKPNVDDMFLTNQVCNLIFQSLSGTNLVTNQLRLLDFQFNVIPVEFISYIYEIFLSEKQKENGIYYTPKKLAQLIVDDVIVDDKIGTVLDPSCGSGMFLSVAFQKLLEISKEKNYRTIEKQIEHRTKLLSENIFGIEKEITAQRFTIFSLSLQLFRDLDPLKIKEYIANQLKDNGKVDLFEKFDLSQNILCANTLNLNEKPFESLTFDYIVGNPPFFEVKQTDEFINEIEFLNNYRIEIEDKKVKAKDIVGKHQISQCFLLKIKDWSNENTRFGFVSNSSNFYNDNSNKFQNFFYSNYNIEKVYELSKVKKILFEKAKESVVSLIFTNQLNPKNKIEYYPVDMGIFSEKPFELLIIQEDKIVELKQKELRAGKIRFRDYLVGNEFDRKLLNAINNESKLKAFIIKEDGEYFIHRGIEIVGFNEIKREYNVTLEEWSRLTQENKDFYFDKFRKDFTSSAKSMKYNTPFIKPNNINNFRVVSNSAYLGDISNFHRPRKENLFNGKKIIWSRIGKRIKAIFIEEKIFFDFDLYVVKLNNNQYNYFITAVLNSDLINYFINLFLKKRVESSYPKIGIEDFVNIPIPNDLDEDLVKQISKISKDLTESKYEFTDKVEAKLNELIFDLYDLSYIEKQRIKDYFLNKEKVTKTKGELERYKATLMDTIGLYFNEDIDLEFSNQNHNPIVAKIYFSKKKSNSPSAEKTAYYLLNEIFEQNPNENFLATQEKIFGNDCVYIIKDNLNTSWTETKAYEDGQDILKNIR